MSNFIATESLGITGEKGEQIVWESLKKAFCDRDCLAYWRYPIFEVKNRQEPDILIADAELGLIIIEVKSIKINQIINIQGYCWQYQNFYTKYGNPYQQGVNQLFSLLKYCDRETILKQQVTARVLIALPDITQLDWQNRGFHLLPSNPPILFQDHLFSVSNILAAIEQAAVIRSGNDLTTTQWELLQAILAGTPVYLKEKIKVQAGHQSRVHLINKTRSRLLDFALEQEKIAKQIPLGMQKIRGVAGSGKTVLLCQKAAMMSLKYPEWQIALVFFSRSLYDTITEQVARWIRYYSLNKQQYSQEQSNLKILHAWGSKNQPGFYSTICNLVQKSPLSVNYTISKKPNEALAEVCLQLLETVAIPQVYDAILIDEAQDLLSDSWRYQDKQPFFWLAYQALRPVNSVNPDQRRLIWAYDEIQSLDNFRIPDAGELFGESLGHLVTGYTDEIEKTVILTSCYRTPQPIIILATAIAIGLLRKKGLLIRLRDRAEWSTLGYQITGDLKVGNQVTVTYNSSYAPNLIYKLWQQELIEFNSYSSRQQELTVLAQKINYNIQHEQLQPFQNILVIVLGNYHDSFALQILTAKFLMRQGINIYIPGSNAYNTLVNNNPKDRTNLFWFPGAVTISTIHRAKGQEADLVYLIALDHIAQEESNLYLRNQLFIALTRSKGWVNLSGIKDYEFYQEMMAVINSKNTFQFTYQTDFIREVAISDRANILQGYAMGRRNFRYANLQQADLSNQNLANINLIAADLTGANLTNTNLSNAKLIEANLTGANLTNTNLSNAKLMGANFKNAILLRTNIERADLTNISL